MMFLFDTLGIKQIYNDKRDYRYISVLSTSVFWKRQMYTVVSETQYHVHNRAENQH